MDQRDHVACFVFLKTILEGILESPAKEHPQLLSKSLAPLNEGTIDCAFDSVLRPIQIQLHRCAQSKRSSDSIEILLNCLHCLIRKSSITKLDRFFQVYVCTVNVLPQGDPGEKDDWSEECKLSLVRCWLALFEASSDEVLLKFYADTICYKKISPLIYHCLNYAQEIASLKLRTEAINCVYTSLQLDSNIAQAVLLDVFPGVLMACAELVPSVPSTENHAVTRAGVKLWTAAMAVAPSSSKVWNEKACDKIVVFTRNIVGGAACHPDARVRLALAVGAARILREVPFSLLHNNFIPIVEGLIQLSEDSDSKVKGTARRGLEVLQGWEVGALLARGLYDHLEQLPRLLKSSESNGRDGVIALLAGYLRLSTVLKSVVTSQRIMSQLVMALLSVAAIDFSVLPETHVNHSIPKLSSHVVPVEPVADDGKKAASVSVPLQWTNVATLELIREALGQGAACIAYFLIDEIFSSPTEVILLLNTLVIPGLGECWDGALVEAIFGEYLNRLEPLSSNYKNQLDQRIHAVQTWLLVEGLGKLAKSLGSTKFQTMLIRSLYPLLTAASSGTYVISRAGLSALDDVGEAFGMKRAQIISAHADYLCNTISIRLKSEIDYMSAVEVLSLVLEHCNPSDPTVNDILNRTVLENVVGGKRCNKLSVGHLKLFEVYLRRLGQNSSHTPDQRCFKAKDMSQNVQISLVDRILEYQNTVYKSRNLDSEEDPPEDISIPSENVNPYQKDEDQPDPEHIVIADAIVRSCSNLIPSNDVTTVMLAITVVEAGVCGVLRESEKILLPAVHSVWSPLVGRFKSKHSPLIFSRAFTMLEKLAACTGDFLRSRVIKEVLPSLLTILKDNASQSSGTSVSYTFTQLYKLQLNLLNGLGRLCHSIELEGEKLEQLLDATQPYLQETQPSQLREACFSLWTILYRLEPYSVWLRCMSLEKDAPELAAQLKFFVDS